MAAPNYGILHPQCLRIACAALYPALATGCRRVIAALQKGHCGALSGRLQTAFAQATHILQTTCEHFLCSRDLGEDKSKFSERYVVTSRMRQVLASSALSRTLNIAECLHVLARLGDIQLIGSSPKCSLAKTAMHTPAKLKHLLFR